MNRFGVFTILFLLGSTGFSQTTSNHSRILVFSTSDDLQSSCPIEIKAKMELGAGRLLPIDLKENAEKLEVTLNNSQPLRIVRLGSRSTAFLPECVLILRFFILRARILLRSREPLLSIARWKQGAALRSI